HPRTAPFACGERATQGDKRAREEFDKTRRAHQRREIGAPMHRDILWVVMLEGPGMTPGKRDEERQDLAESQCRLARAVPLAYVQQVAVVHGLKSLAAIVHITEESKQLVQRGSRRARVDSWWNQPSIREPLVFSRSTLIPNSRYITPKSVPARGVPLTLYCSWCVWGRGGVTPGDAVSGVFA